MLLRRSQGGFTLIELSVAMLIALFLLGGLFTVLQNTRNTFGNQNALAQLQDNERLAMTLITDVVQAAGYFPDPFLNTSSSTLLAGTLAAGTPVTGTVVVGQPIKGAYRAADPGDAITVRYATSSGDTVILCNGTSNTTGATLSYVNTFSVDANGNLVCQLGTAFNAPAAAAPLVSGVKRLDILYGVKRDFTTTDNNVDTYVRADQMAAADWSNITSVKVQITFVNPMATTPSGTAVPGQPALILFQRIIAVMNRSGVKT
jgi:type IV pilus assembly protein PilW